MVDVRRLTQLTTRPYRLGTIHVRNSHWLSVIRTCIYIYDDDDQYYEHLILDMLLWGGEETRNN